MKISFITTVDHNVGDDFVREGLKYLLRQRFADREIEFRNIHKHSPITCRDGFERIRNLRASNILDRLIPFSWTSDKVRSADILVQSGAPVYWCHTAENNHCYNNEWYRPLVRKRLMQKGINTLFTNFAAGTCQTYHSDGSEYCSDCLQYMRDLHKLCVVSSVRDQLSHDVYRGLGVDVPVLPCSSIFAVDEHRIESTQGEYVAVNFMPRGAHYMLGQNIDLRRWEKEFKNFYTELKQREKVVFACHNDAEVSAARNVDSQAEIFYAPDDYVAYMNFYSAAKLGIVNRVHAAFMMASMGKPSVVIGNDSRARMVSEIGLEHFFVNDANQSLLLNQYEKLLAGTNQYAERFHQIKQQALQGYLGLLNTI
ncbi:MAG: polysaccharide pyruvyl transferase family protein [Arenicella sp.]|nr:polysaccharide pyruvyl transferase family protein [Arenicella sp.]